MKGANTVNTTGIYGSMGVANALNFPGARHFNITWRHLNSRLWLLGGEGIDNNNQNPQDNMNDLWGYNPPCNPDSILASPNKICSGNTSTLTAYTQYSANVAWYATNTGTNVIGSGSVFVTPTLSANNNSSTITYYAQSNNCSLTPKTIAQLTVNPLPTIIATCASTHICVHDSNTLTATGANSYTWSNLVTSSIAVITLTNNNSSGVASYTVSGINNYNCVSSAVASFSYSYARCVGAVKNFDAKNLLVDLYPNPSNGTFTLKNESGLESLHLEIYNALGQLVLFTEPNNTQIESTLAPGIYYYAIKQRSVLLKTGKLIID
jgi:hypothetical protein